MRITIGKKLGFGFAIVLGLMLLGAGITLSELSSIKDLQSLTLNVQLPTRGACKNLQRDLNQTQNKGRQVILAGADSQRRDAARKSFDASWVSVANDMVDLDGYASKWAEQENRTRLADIKDRLPRLRTMQESAEQIAGSGKPQDILEAGNHFTDQATAEADSIKKSLDEMADYFSVESLRGIHEIDSRSRTLYLMLIATSLAALTIGAIVAIFLSRSISRTAHSVLTQAQAIAAGDLTKDDLEVSSEDELGDLTKAVNEVNQSMKDVIFAITENAQHVASASAELSSTSQHITANAEETSAQAGVVSEAAQRVNSNLQSVSTGAEEMAATIQSIATNAHEAATVASNAVQTAQAANTTVAKLGDASAEIGEVIKVITSIAQQTNLLALNATIEAARAGDAGKGFAVVANEVKELAKQTAKATEDISRKITAIQTETAGAVEAIGTISGVIGQINDISGTIATAVEEQSATTNEMNRSVGDAAKGSGEITHNIGGVAEAARGTSTSAQESQKAANELAEMALELRSLVSQFKVAGSGTVLPPKKPVKSLAAAAGR